MKKRVFKLIVCIMLISALMIGFCTAYAHAALPNRTIMQRFNAWVASAMVAANITIGSTVAPVQQVLDSLSYGADMPWTPTYTYQGPTWDDDIMDRSTIFISPDVVTIDGVSYTDIWLSNDASQKFRVNAFDLESAWNIASNSNGTYASGSGFIDETPIFSINGVNQSQRFSIPSDARTGSYDSGLFYLTISPFNQYNAWTNYYYPDDSSIWTGTTQYASANWPPTAWVQYDNGSWGFFALRNGGQPTRLTNYDINKVGGFVADPFDFDWVSGTVPAEQLPEDYGMHFLVPSSYTDQGSGGDVYNYDIHDLITLNPNITDPDGYQFNFDPELNPDYELDLDTNEALGAIISAVIAAYLADLLDGDGVKIEYTRNGEPEPQPGVIDPLPDPDPAPEDPVPGTTIADTDWTKLDEILRWIQSTIDSIRHLTESLQTMLDSIFDAIQSAIQHISEIPEAIRELADKILEDIELGPAKLFDKAIDILKTLFLPLLLPIRAMMNLWHYVVEWFQSVSSPFTWIFGIMTSTSYNMVLPVYALLAGGICISIYKALGR